MRICEGLTLIGRFRSPSVISLSLAALVVSACSSTSTIDGEGSGNTLSTADLQNAPQRVADGLKEIDRRVEEFPEQLSERFAFDEERAVRVDGQGFQVSGDTVSYILQEWIPQVTGNATREEERAARAEEELRTQVASTRNTAAAPTTLNNTSSMMTTGPQPIDLTQATPMSPTQSGVSNAGIGASSQFAASPSYLNTPVLNNYTASPSASSSGLPAVTKSVPGGLEGAGRFFDQNGYTLDKMRRGSPVPPVFARRMPFDMNNSVPMNKDVFLRLMLPLALKANAEIAAERALIERSGYSGPISNAPADVKTIAAKYDIQSNTTNLLQRVDVIPVSLILSQAGLESGWGTSRYVQEGNALFGQRVWDASQPGMTPSDRNANQNHRVRTFTSLEESVRSYAKNLNTNAAYLEMRRTRANFRRSGRSPSARDLIPHLSSYSEDPTYYSGTINTIVTDNRLTDFDRSRLSGGQPMNLYL